MCVCVYMCVYMCMCVFTCVFECVHVCMLVSVFVFVHARVCVLCVRVYVCSCVYLVGTHIV